MPLNLECSFLLIYISIKYISDNFDMDKVKSCFYGLCISEIIKYKKSTDDLICVYNNMQPLCNPN